MKTKERPNCRRMIIKAGWRPNPAPETWDGETAVTSDSQEVRMTAGFRKQMGRMIEEGYWGKAISLHTIQSKLNESEEERERRLQDFLDGMVILNDTRPIPVNSGDRLLSVEHAWPQQYEWDWEVAGHIPIKRPPFATVPAWVYEEENPVSATARVVLVFLCNRGLLSGGSKGSSQLSVSVPKKAIGDALSISEGVAGRAMLELEDLGIVEIVRVAPRLKKEPGYCNFFNPDGIRVIEDPGRWARIKDAQAQEQRN